MKLLLCLTIVYTFFPIQIFAKESCKFSFDKEKTKLTWTAFKFTEKTGVSGSFQKMMIKNSKPSHDAIGAVRSIEFTIDSNSANTSNPERDQKIIKFFFGNSKSPLIKGSFKDIKKEGSANVQLTWNKITSSIPIRFSLTNDTDLEASGTIDVNQWKMEKGITDLNKECFDLHKGKDGQSKLWSTVDFKITTKLKKVCKKNP